MRRALAAAVIGLAVFPAATARAQSRDEIARAEALFNAGKALTDAGQHADACAKFAESKRLAPGLGVTLYLADCYEHIGRTASAWTEFRSAEGLARERSDKRADVARGRAQALEPKLNRLTIAVARSIPRSGLQVLRDGSPVAEEELGLDVPVDPGDHVVIVTSPGHKMRSFDVHVGPEGQTATVHLESLENEGAAPALTPTPIPTPAPTETPTPTPTPAPALASTSTPATSDGGATRRWMGLGVGGLGVIGVGIGGALGLVAMSKRDQSNQGPSAPCDGSDHCTGSGLSLRKDAQNAASEANIAFAVGGAALAAGVVLYVTAPRAGSGTGVVVVPAPIAGGGGAIIRGRF
jgi:hypothetical protein